MKKVLSVLMAVCILFTVFSCMASAIANFSIGELPATFRNCPDKVLGLVAPEIEGGVPYAQGWEIQTADGVWIPYDGQPLTEADNGKAVRYFAASDIGEYVYSENVCTLIVKHNPEGEYKYDGMYHWRECADCDGQVDKDGHTTLVTGTKNDDKICQVCGQRRTSQYTGLVTFWNWIFDYLIGMIGELGNLFDSIGA